MLSLPIDASQDEIEAALHRMGRGGRLVLSAPTGSGKSTRVPVWCHRRGLGPVLVIEPRRIACRTLAQWIAQGLRESVGGLVGYSVRFEQKFQEDTQILFVTPGVARRLLSDGQIQRYTTVIFDEFHERSWETDIVMAALAAARGLQRLVLMSATIAADRLVKTYDAEKVECFGRSYPVDISYRSETPETTVPSTYRMVDRVVRAVTDSWDRQGGTLVFLPGLGAMREVQQRLARLPVCLMHGAFASPQQDLAFAADKPRIVLATNVAESSLTLPGITMVIDSGLEKRPVHQSGYVALSTVPVASSSAEQRAGRAGRTSPGRCLRLWDEKARLEASRPPDIERMELDEMLLFLAALPEGLATPMHWLDRPPAFAWERALQRLKEKELIDSAGRATSLGHRVGRLPVDTPWARVLALAPKELQADLCDLHAVSAGRRSLFHPGATHDHIQQRKIELGDDPWKQVLAIVRKGDADRHGLDKEALSESRRLALDLRTALECGQGPEKTTPHPDLGLYLARHWPERHFVRRPNRQAWSNGQVECQTARGQEPPEEWVAAVFLVVDPVVARGLKVELQGRWPLPVSLSLLRQAGYGHPEISKIRFRGNRVSAKVTWTFAGRVLGQDEEDVVGATLRQALVQLADQGAWMKGLREAWEEHAFYQALSPDPDRSALGLKAHLEALGVETSQDLELLEPPDLFPPDLGDEALKKAYPRLYLYGGAVFDVTYFPEKGQVLLTWRSGPKGAKVQVQHLPRWNGWKVDIDERGRRLPVR